MRKPDRNFFSPTDRRGRNLAQEALARSSGARQSSEVVDASIAQRKQIEQARLATIFADISASVEQALQSGNPSRYFETWALTSQRLRDLGVDPDQVIKAIVGEQHLSPVFRLTLLFSLIPTLASACIMAIPEVNSAALTNQSSTAVTVEVDSDTTSDQVIFPTVQSTSTLTSLQVSTEVSQDLQPTVAPAVTTVETVESAPSSEQPMATEPLSPAEPMPSVTPSPTVEPTPTQNIPENNSLGIGGVFSPEEIQYLESLLQQSEFSQKWKISEFIPDKILGGILALLLHNQSESNDPLITRAIYRTSKELDREGEWQVTDLEGARLVNPNAEHMGLTNQGLIAAFDNDNNPVTIFLTSTQRWVLYDPNSIDNLVREETKQFIEVTISVPTANIRSGPGTNYAIAAKTSKDKVFNVGGRTADNNWFQIVDSSGQIIGWISSTVIKPNPDLQLADIISPENYPPTPVPLPTRRPETIKATATTYAPREPIPGYRNASDSEPFTRLITGTFTVVKTVGNKYLLRCNNNGNSFDLYILIDDLSKASIVTGGNETKSTGSQVLQVTEVNPIRLTRDDELGSWDLAPMITPFGPERRFRYAYGATEQVSYTTDASGQITQLEMLVNFVTTGKSKVIISPNTVISVYDQPGPFKGLVDIGFLTRKIKLNDTVIVYIDPSSPMPTDGSTLLPIAVTLKNYDPGRTFP